MNDTNSLVTNNELITNVTNSNIGNIRFDSFFRLYLPRLRITPCEQAG